MLIAWLIFFIIIIVVFVLDLGVFHRKAHEIHYKEALLLSALWISFALAFNVGIYYFLGHADAIEFFTGFLIEKALSVDNIFVFIIIFRYFNVPSLYQHKVLFWGILGALIMRGIFIFAGVSLVQKFHWLIYVFGIMLIITAIKLLTQKDKKMKIERNPVLRMLRKFLRITDHYEKGKFFTHLNKLLYATPLFVVLIVIETTDIVFAVDSIPAIFSITMKPFIIYTSNVFAILGLRALYFALHGIMNLFYYLNYGLSIILAFVGVKMLLSAVYKIPTPIALSVIALTLLISILASILYPPKSKNT